MSTLTVVELVKAKKEMEDTISGVVANALYRFRQTTGKSVSSVDVTIIGRIGVGSKPYTEVTDVTCQVYL